MRKFFLLTLGLLTTSVFCQKYSLGDVTLEELREKVCPIDTAAAASFYFKSTTVFFPLDVENSFKCEIKVKQKIKIYKKDGYELATVVIPFYSSSDTREKVQLVSGITYNEEGGKIVKSKIKDDGVFVTERNKYWSTKSFVFPNVKEGSILELEYYIDSPRFWGIPDFQFQEDVPVLAAKMVTVIPEYYDFRVSSRGNYAPTASKSKKSRIEVQGKWNFEEYVSTYEMKNIPALPDEPFVSNINNYRSSLTFELASLRNADGQVKNFSTDWASVAQGIYKNDFSEQLAAKNFYEEELDAAVKDAATEYDRMLATIKFLKSKVVWNEMNGVYSDEGIKSAYKKKTGNFAELNLLLINMLQYLKIKADPVLISTRAHGIPLFPSTEAFNGVICIARINNVKYLIDATDKNPIPNLLPNRDLNWIGRYISKDGYTEEINLMPTTPSINAVTMMGSLSANGNLKGNMRKQYTDHMAKRYKLDESAEVTDAYLETLEKELSGAVIDNYKKTFQNENSFSFIESFAFESEGVCDIIAGKLQLKPLLFFTTSENPFKQDNRESPIDFSFPNQHKVTFIITIPDGYAVESLPTPVSVSLEDKSLTYRFNCSNENNTIRVTATTDINQAILPADAYPAIKAIFAKMVEAEKQRIVLAKKS